MACGSASCPRSLVGDACRASTTGRLGSRPLVPCYPVQGASFPSGHWFDKTPLTEPTHLGSGDQAMAAPASIPWHPAAGRESLAGRPRSQSLPARSAMQVLQGRSCQEPPTHLPRQPAAGSRSALPVGPAPGAGNKGLNSTFPAPGRVIQSSDPTHRCSQLLPVCLGMWASPHHPAGPALWHLAGTPASHPRLCSTFLGPQPRGRLQHHGTVAQQGSALAWTEFTWAPWGCCVNQPSLRALLQPWPSLEGSFVLSPLPLPTAPHSPPAPVSLCVLLYSPRHPCARPLLRGAKRQLSLDCSGTKNATPTHSSPPEHALEGNYIPAPATCFKTD